MRRSLPVPRLVLALAVSPFLVLLVGLAVPSFMATTLAAPPAQTPIPPPTPIDTAAALNALIALALTAIMGGALALLLDDLPQWKNWQNPSAKTFIVLVLNAAIGAALLAAQPYIPSILGALPAALVAFIGFFVSYFVNQFSHQQDVIFAYRQLQAKPFAPPP